MSDWNDCECNPIAPPTTEAGPPGAAGLPGEDGVDGKDGKNAFSVTTQDFTTIAAGSPITIELAEVAWLVPGQYIHIEGAGNYRVINASDATFATVESTGAIGNAPSGTHIPSGAKVGPAGASGPAGSAVTFPITIPQGGTGQTTPDAAFNALSILTTKGDLLGHDGAANVRVSVGTDAYTLIADSLAPRGWRWGQLDLTKGVTGILPMANGGTGVGTLPDGAILVGNGIAPVSGLKCNFTATTDPTTADDSPHQGYSVGSRWFNIETEQEWVCTDSTDSTAIWKCTTSSTGTAIVRKEVSASYVVEDGVNLVAVKATGPVVISLMNGTQYSSNTITVKDEGTLDPPTITIDPSGSQTIEGLPTYNIITKGGSVTFYWTTAGWRILDLPGRPLPVDYGGTGESNFTAKYLVRMNNGGLAMESLSPGAAISNVTPTTPADGSIIGLPFNATTYTQSEIIALRNATEGVRDTVASLETRVAAILNALRVSTGASIIAG